MKSVPRSEELGWSKNVGSYSKPERRRWWFTLLSVRAAVPRPRLLQPIPDLMHGNVHFAHPDYNP
jgi:hypothetical protein